MDKDFEKHFTLSEELEDSTKLIKLGFGELQNINFSNDFYFLPFQLLSSGFERFMKCYICFGYYEAHGKYPNNKYLLRIGHDLFGLLKEIKDKYFVVDSRPIFQDDIKLITENSDLFELLNILSEFGKKARYYNLDFVTGAVTIGINPNKEWQKFETRIINSNKKIKKKVFDIEFQDEVYQFVSRHILVLFERFVSALSRQFTFGFLGEKANQFSMPVFDFALLYDRDFGNTDYRSFTSRYKQTPKKVHKRTLADEFERKTNKNFVSKKIKKKDYDAEWPFYSDEIIIECRDKHWCIVTIDGFDYGLNGAAQGKYKLEHPTEAGVAIIGKSTDDFIKLAFEMVEKTK